MIRIVNIVLLLLAGWIGSSIANSARPKTPASESPSSAPPAKELSSVATLPVPDEGVTELKFSQLYQSPAGPRGMEFSPTLKSLEGKRVRILGYMVRSVHPSSRTFILSPYPVVYDKCTADSIPTTAIHVVMPPSVKAGYTGGMLLLTGTLSLGGKVDPYGQVSHIRLLLDPPSAPAVPQRSLSQP